MSLTSNTSELSSLYVKLFLHLGFMVMAVFGAKLGSIFNEMKTKDGGDCL